MLRLSLMGPRNILPSTTVAIGIRLRTQASRTAAAELLSPDEVECCRFSKS